MYCAQVYGTTPPPPPPPISFLPQVHAQHSWSEVSHSRSAKLSQVNTGRLLALTDVSSSPRAACEQVALSDDRRPNEADTLCNNRDDGVSITICPVGIPSTVQGTNGKLLCRLYTMGFSTNRLNEWKVCSCSCKTAVLNFGSHTCVFLMFSWWWQQHFPKYSNSSQKTTTSNIWHYKPINRCIKII